MADDRHRQDYRQQGQTEEQLPLRVTQSPHPHAPRQQLLPPGEPQRPGSSMAAAVTLPPMHDTRSPYGPPPPGHPASRGFHDQRFDSPNTSNGYPSPGQHAPPPHQQHQQHAQPGQPPQGYLPPLQPQGDNRSPGAYPPPPDQRMYYEQRQPYPPPQEGYYYRGPPGQGPNYSQDYRGGPPPPGYADYAQPGPGSAAVLGQAAPRQRTSIACRYCRKRKIRCSGYQSAPGGKCQNCSRMNQECIFQPVSSSSTTAFIPVSAVPGGVPPGTQLFGAYGEPLSHSPYGPPPQHGQHPQHAPQHPGHYPPQYAHHPQHGPQNPQYYQQPVQSPTESYSSHGDQRSEASGQGQIAGTRRRRTSEEPEDYRRPPPSTGRTDEDSRRRSPAEFSNHSSPSGLPYPAYPTGSRNSPRNPSMGQPPPGAGGRSPGVRTTSSGNSTPAASAVSAGGQAQTTGSSVMSLSNLVDKSSDIDKTMIDRLNRPRDR